MGEGVPPPLPTKILKEENKVDMTELAIVRIPTVAEADAESFAAYLDWLQHSHYTTVTPDEVYDWLRGAADLLPPSSVLQQTKPILITFDEGGEDIFNFAYPELLERGMKATVYVVTGFLDGIADLGPFTEQDPLTWDEVREMVASGLITIGTMGRTGADLTALVQDPASGDPPVLPAPRPRTFEELLNEFQKAKDRVQVETGVACLHAAYPQGKINPIVHAAVGYIGFRTCRGYSLYDPFITYDVGVSRLERENSYRLLLSSYAVVEGFPTPPTPVQPPGEELAPLTFPESWSSTSEGWEWLVAGNLFQGASTQDGTREYLMENTLRNLRKTDTRYLITALAEITITDGDAGIQVLEYNEAGDAIAQPTGSPDIAVFSTSVAGEFVLKGIYKPSSSAVKRISIAPFSNHTGAQINIRDIHMVECMTL